MLVLYTPVIKRLAKKTETALQSAYRETSIFFRHCEEWHNEISKDDELEQNGTQG